MANKSNQNLYIILALLLCVFLLSPYLGIFSLFDQGAETPLSAIPVRSISGERSIERDADPYREPARGRKEPQRNKLSEIEQLLDRPDGKN